MAEVAAVRIHNIVSITQGSNTYKGVRSVAIQADKGKLLPVLEEGKLYPSNAELVGTSEFPVTVSVVFESDGAAMLALLAEAKGTLAIVVKVAGGAPNKTISIVNFRFLRMSKSIQLQDFSRPSVEGAAHSADGEAFPMSVA